MLTTGQAPRTDLVPAMREVMRSRMEIVEAGVLDQLRPEEIREMAPRDGDMEIYVRLRDGAAIVGPRSIRPRMQALVDEVVAERRPSFIVVLCGLDWSDLRSPVPIVDPGTLFPAIVSSIAHGRRLGVIKPLAGQKRALNGRSAAVFRQK